jgi:hypothetical protein
MKSVWRRSSRMLARWEFRDNVTSTRHFRTQPPDSSRATIPSARRTRPWLDRSDPISGLLALPPMVVSLPNPSLRGNSKNDRGIEHSPMALNSDIKASLSSASCSGRSESAIVGRTRSVGDIMSLAPAPDRGLFSGLRVVEEVINSPRHLFDRLSTDACGPGGGTDVC